MPNFYGMVCVDETIQSGKQYATYPNKSLCAKTLSPPKLIVIIEIGVY
jgi:hypothetical protein